MKCDECGMECPEDKITHVHVEGNVKNVCDECATAVKGFR